MKLKRKQVAGLYTKLTSQEIMVLGSKKVSYARQRSEDMIVSILKEQEGFNRKEIAKRGPVPEDYIKKEEEIIATYAEKGPDGNYIVQGMFNIPKENMEDYTKAKEALCVEYGEVGEKIKAYNETMDKYFDEEIEIDLYKVKEDDLPDNINSIQRKLLSDIIMD